MPACVANQSQLELQKFSLCAFSLSLLTDIFHSLPVAVLFLYLKRSRFHYKGQVDLFISRHVIASVVTSCVTCFSKATPTKEVK